MQNTQQYQEQQQSPKAADLAKFGDAAQQHAADAEVQTLTQALREAEQRASAAELAVVTVQRTHTEAVEQSARLQASCGPALQHTWIARLCLALPCPA